MFFVAFEENFGEISLYFGKRSLEKKMINYKLIQNLISFIFLVDNFFAKLFVFLTNAALFLTREVCIALSWELSRNLWTYYFDYGDSISEIKNG